MKILHKAKNKTDFYLDKLFIVYLRLFYGLSIGTNCRISRKSSIKCLYGTVKIGSNCVIEPNVRIKVVQNHENRKYVVIINSNVFVGFSSIIDAGNFVEIGENTMVGPMVFITDVDHKFISNEAPIALQGAHFGKTIVEDNVWICAHSQILRNSYISKNSIVGANATVNKCFSENSLIVGIPAENKKELFK